jgi:hypothetical protein
MDNRPESKSFPAFIGGLKGHLGGSFHAETKTCLFSKNYFQKVTVLF